MMPLGIRCSAVFTPLMTKVWPALWPPWKRTTPCALSVSQSTSLPLPSSPHWVPTTTTFRPVVTLMMFRFSDSDALDFPLPGLLDQFAVAVEFVDLALVAGQHADHGLALAAQRGDGLGQPVGVAPGRADCRAQRPRRQHAHQLAHVEAEADGRAVATEHRAHLVVAAAAHQRIAGAFGVDAEAHAA